MDKDELLVKYLAGEAGADERAQAEIWMDASAENRKYYDHFKQLWDESQKLAHRSDISGDLAWNRFRQRVQNEYTAAPKPKINWQWLKIAAVILLVSAAALWAPYFFTRKNDSRATTASVSKEPVKNLKSISADHIKVDTLSDGSVITLNKNSSLGYPAVFRGHTRNVELEGEAFFNVKHDPNRAFIIKVNDLLINDIGTSFNVKSVNDKTEVIVETGIVSVSKQTKRITLYAGEKLTAFTTDTILKKEPNGDTLYKYYRYNRHIYAFKNRGRAKTDGPFDINKHPDLLKQILKDPRKWSKLLKNYSSQSENIQVRRAVIRSVMDEMVKEKIVAKADIRSFRLNENELIINDIRQSDAVHQRFKDKFIKEPGYTIYFGGSPRNGSGVFLSPDSL